jgi:hypothetical protein
MRRPAAAIGYVLSAVLVWCVLWMVAVLVRAIFAPPHLPKHRVTWLVWKNAKDAKHDPDCYPDTLGPDTMAVPCK